MKSSIIFPKPSLESECKEERCEPNGEVSPSNNTSILECNNVIVVIGANGSGKTRLGSWLETYYLDKSHRVSAQKSLHLQTSYSSSSTDEALSRHLYGNAKMEKHSKFHHRWQGKPNTYLLNDFDSLMTYLFSDDYDHSLKYKEESQKTQARLEPPKTKLDIVKQVWEEVLLSRKLKISSGKIEAHPVGNAEAAYNGSEMSDGERVILYMIGQTLSAPKEAILIIDEPEIHIHKSIQAMLWDKIEIQRPDCIFVYLTHDLDFASSRIQATKICIRDYSNKTDKSGNKIETWDWFCIEQKNEIPEEIYLKILGSRKPVLFVEGNKSSYDRLIYTYLYPSFTVITCEGCGQVMSFTKAFSKMKYLHRMDCFGIIDRDKRTDEQIEHIKGQGIFVLGVSEIENLFLIKEVLEVLAEDSKKGDFANFFNEVKKTVFNMLKEKNEKEKLISAITATKIEANFKNFNAKAVGKEALAESFNILSNHIDADVLYQETEKMVNDILDNENYDELIKTYNNKGLLVKIVGLLGRTYKDFPAYIKNLLTSNDGQKLIEAMKKYTPVINSTP